MEALLDEQLVQQFAAQLSARERKGFEELTRRIAALPTQRPGLAEFLSAYVQDVADLYAATAVAVWFRAPHEDALIRKVDVGWAQVRLDAPADQEHHRLVQFALTQPGPLAAPPFSSPRAAAGVANPTDSFLLLSPVHHQRQGIAVVELVLGPRPLRRPHEHLLTCYLQWLEWLASVLRAGLERNFAAAEQPLLAARAVLQETTRRVEVMQEEIRREVEQALRQFVGRNFGSLDANQAVAKQVHALLEGKGLRVRCPECGAPAILRCQKAGNAKTGAFVFDHYLETGRTFHGGPSTFPRLTLIPKPPRRVSRPRSSAGADSSSQS